MKTILKTLDSKGVTLIEIMVALALISIVAAGLITSYTGQQESHLSQKQVVEMQQNIRAGIYRMSHEIRMAGYDPYGGSSGAGIISAGDGTSQANALTFTYVADDDGVDNAEDLDGVDSDNDGVVNGTDGTTDEKGELKTVSFYLYDAYSDGDSDLGMRVGNTLGAIAENIVNNPGSASTTFFQYLNSQGNVLTAPININQISAVRINLVAYVGAGVTDHTLQNATRTVTVIVQRRNN